MLALLAVLAVTGCDRDEIKVYRVGKDAAPPVPKVNAPEGWTAVSPGQMRVASFAIKDVDGKQADVSVIPLPGSAGGIPANVNRWRGQVGLPPATEDEIKQMAEAIQISGQPADLYDMAGTNTSSSEAVRILASIQNRDDMAWFFKMTGDDQLVAKQKSNFVAYLKTFDPRTAPGPSTLPPSHPPIESSALPPGHPEIGAPPAAGGEPAREGQPQWQVPSGWTEVPGGQFLVAKFMLSGAAGAQAAVNVSKSAGQGGGLEENVNRWRKQLALSPLTAAELAKSVQSIPTPGGQASAVEMTGTDGKTGQPAKLVGVMLSRNDESWFYKLMGDSQVVETHKDEFLKFVQSVKY